MVRDELLTSWSKMRESKEELREANDELHDKTAPLDGARREDSEAVNSSERLTEKCYGLCGDLHQQITLVAQRDKIIGRLRTKPVPSGLLGGSLFSRRLLTFIQVLDFNFDLPSDDEAEESFSADHSGEPDTPNEAHSPSSDV